MDFDIGGAISGAIIGFKFGGPWGAVAGFFIGGAAGGDAKRSAKNKARDAYNAQQRDRAQMVQSATAPHNIIYGQALASGPLAYAESTGDKGQYLHLVVLLAAHEVQEIGEIYLGDTPVGTLDGNGFATSGSAFGVANIVMASASSATTTVNLAQTPVSIKAVVAIFDPGNDLPFSEPVLYTLAGTTVTITSTPSFTPSRYDVQYDYQASFAPLVRIKKHLGSTTQTADADLVAESGGKWSTNHRLRGIAYLYVRLEYNQDIFGATGLPNIRAVVKGRKVRDPRTGLTAWSDNAALCAADYLRTYMLADAAEVIDAELTTAADLCDGLVTLTAGGATEARYTANGVLSTEAPPRENLDALTEAMAGTAPYVQGRFAIRAGAHTSAVLTLTEDSLADGSPIEIQAANPRTELINRIVPKYVEPAKLYATVEATPVTNAMYVSDDGGADLPLDVTYDLCTGQLRAQRLAKIALERNRQGLRVNLSTNLTAYDLMPGDVVAVTISRYGWSAKLFEVESRNLDIATMQVRLGLRETAAAVWDWAYGEATTTDLTPNTSLTSPFAVPAALASLAVATGTAHLQRAADGTIITRGLLTWTQSPDIHVLQGGSIEVQWAGIGPTTLVWQQAPTAAGDATSAYIGPLNDGQVTMARVRARTSLLQSGPWASVTFQPVGKSQAPADVALLASAQEQFGVRLAWPDIADLDLDVYELRQGASWAAGTPLSGSAPTLVRGSTYLWSVQVAGDYTVWIKARDTSGNESTSAASLLITINVPSAPAISRTIAGSSEVLSWTIPASAAPIDRYEIRHGSTWAGGTPVDTTKATALTRRVDYGGARRWWVAAIDAAGNVGTAGYLDAEVVAPGVVTSTRADVIDNNALLYWAAPATGSLPVDRYEVRKGASWAGGTVVGSNGNSTFTTVFETVAGAYTYWVAAIDTAGNAGTAVGIPATIAQPPDYVLRANIDSTFGGTLSNMYLEAGALVGPVVSETWAAHFSGHAWSTIQDQIDAGYPLYAMPSTTSGTYTEVIDYGATLPATTITCTLAATVLAGTVTPSCQISVSNTSSTGPWTALAAGESALGSSFRWVKVVYTFTATAGANLVRVDSLNIKLAAKLKTDSGTGTITNATAGIAVSFGVTFVDADTPIVQPAGTSPLLPVVDFTDAPNPTGFTVYLYDLSGTKVTGSFSWTARGY